MTTKLAKHTARTWADDITTTPIPPFTALDHAINQIGQPRPLDLRQQHADQAATARAAIAAFTALHTAAIPNSRDDLIAALAATRRAGQHALDQLSLLATAGLSYLIGAAEAGHSPSAADLVQLRELLRSVRAIPSA